MHNPHATSTCLDGCDLSWTTGMPVHPETAPALKPGRLPRKALREMVVLAAVCVISTIVFVPPLAGVLRSESSELVSRDLQTGASLIAAPKADATLVAAVATPAIESRAVHATARTRRETPRPVERRALGTRIGRALAGDGRYRVQPFPRPAE